MKNIEKLLFKAGFTFGTMNCSSQIVDFRFGFKKRDDEYEIVECKGNAPTFFVVGKRYELNSELKKTVEKVWSGHDSIFIRNIEGHEYLYWMYPQIQNGLTVMGHVCAINTLKFNYPGTLLSIFDIHGNLKYINNLVSERMGIKLTVNKPRHTTEFIHPEDIEEFSNLSKKVNETQIIKYRCINQIGDYQSLVAIRIPIITDNSRAIGFVLINGEV